MTQMVIPTNQSKIEAAFVKFHTQHPEVYYELVRLARKAKARGHDRIGIGMLYEVLRWNYLVDHIDATPKMNNNYRAYYARLIMDREPDLAGIFNTRELAVPHHVAP
jgi:hypothetical protein